MVLSSLSYGKNLIPSILLTFALVVSQSTNATLITYDLDHIVGNTYQYNYTVHNDTLAVAIEEFSVFFSYAEAENLALALPASWDPLITEPDAVLGDGFVDWLDLSGAGIAVGSSLGGFSVQFDWIGGASGPGRQLFEVFDPTNFDVLDSGTTIPEPTTVPLLLLGLVWLTRKHFLNN